MYTVTIEHDSFAQPLVLKYSQFSIAEEQGIELKPARFYVEKPSLRPNGHRRARILLWSGCSAYEAFVPRRTI